MQWHKLRGLFYSAARTVSHFINYYVCIPTPLVSKSLIFIFPFTHHKRQYDMTFAVRVVRRMFLQVGPDLQASIAGLNERDLLPKMEALLGGGAPMASSPDDLSSLLTQLQALNGSDLRLLPATRFFNVYRHSNWWNGRRFGQRNKITHVVCVIAFKRHVSFDYE